MHESYPLTQDSDGGTARVAGDDTGTALFISPCALPVLDELYLGGIPASAAAQAAVHEALAKSTAGIPSLSPLALS